MFKIISIPLCLLSCLLVSGQYNAPPIGQWRGHFSNDSIHQIIKGNKIFIAAKNQIVSIDNSQKIDYLNTSNGLHETAIQKIAWDDINEQLILIYTNSNIDIVKGDQIILINDIFLTNLYSNKKINNIEIVGPIAYLATDFGIVVLDLLKYEIKETLFPNSNSQPTVTYQTTIVNDSLIAITENGIFKKNLKNNGNWIVDQRFKDKSIRNLININKQLYCSNKNTVYAYSTGNSIYQINKDSIFSLKAGQNLIYLFKTLSNKSEILKISLSGTLESTLDPSNLKNPIDLLIDGANTWVIDGDQGLYLKNDQFKWVTLGGPIANLNGKIQIDKAQLIAPSGEGKIGISILNEDGWKYNKQLDGINVINANAAAIDRVNGTWWIGLGKEILQYNPISEKSELILPNTRNGFIKDLHISDAGTVWVLKDQEGILVKENNTWTSYPLPPNFINTGLRKMHIDQNNNAWVIAPENQGIYLFQKNGQQINWKQLTNQNGAGNLPSMNVHSIVSDKTGEIWVGTDNGIGIFQCGDQASNTNCNAFLPRVEVNGFVGLLFQRETVNTIAIDGANRKWIGTNNGVWLMSADYQSVIVQFNRKNSPLPDDSVQQIIINDLTGEVFFMTKKEMVSYRGTATQGAKTQKNILIFPNPVEPGYNGPIAIKNLVENAIVKITDLNGQLVFQTKAFGGQAIWNGKNFNGQKVGAGVYLIFIRDIEGQEKAVGKILVNTGF